MALAFSCHLVYDTYKFINGQFRFEEESAKGSFFDILKVFMETMIRIT